MRNEMMKAEPSDGATLWSGGAPALQLPHAPHAPHLSPRDVADVADAVRQAADRGSSLRIVGAGSWLDAGRPVDAGATRLEVGKLRGIIEYVPSDLTLTAGAATALAEIDAATRPYGQWLPLDPWGTDVGTLGATLATASAGPLAAWLGQPRDLALGLEFVDGRGEVVRGGGRVVKNVAGFDLVRLTVGAWGTLGVITEATVRLRARPDHECTLGLPAPRDPLALARLLGALRTAPLAPLAMELVDPALAGALGAADEGASVVVRLAGNGTSVAAQRRSVGALGDVQDLAPDTWTRWHTSGVRADDWTLRVSTLPSRLAELWDLVGSVVGAPLDGWRHASIERGIMRVVLPAAQAPRTPSIVAALAAALPAHARLTGERLPEPAWAHVPASSDRLSSGVRDTFDPRGILNPGLAAGRRPS